MENKIKVIAMDLDGTLTQHKTPLCDANRNALMELSKKYKLLMVGAGQVMRIWNQLGQMPIDIIGNYGMQWGVYNQNTKNMDIIRDNAVPCNQEKTEKTVSFFRNKYGFTEYAGDSVEYHPSGCITFALLGTKALQEDKLAFDPDRSRRRKIYNEVVEAFPDYCVFVGGSSSFDMAPKPYNKFYALDLYCRENGLSHENVVYIGDDLYCRENGLSHENVVYIGDDYGTGGNDESVYLSDFPYITIDNYLDFPQKIAHLL